MATPSNPNDPMQIEIMKFLIEKTRDAKSPLNISQLAEEFKETIRCSQRTSSLLIRIYKCRSTIHQMKSIDTETKLKMLFALSVPIDENFLKELQKEAVVEVDEKFRITKYEANNGSLHMQKIPENSEDKWESDPEYIELINFLIEKSKDAKSSMNISHLARDFKETSGSSRRISCILFRIHYFRSRIHQMDSIDTEVKVKMIFALTIPIDENFLNELRKDAVVDVDENNRIIEYRANDGSLHMEKVAVKGEDIWESDPEYIELMKFVIERSKDATSPMNVRHLVEEFKKISGSFRGISCLYSRIYHFRSSIHKIDSIDAETKLKMLFALSVPIDKVFLNELRKDAHVEVDEKNRITKYRANDGSSEMEGDHSTSAKKKAPPSISNDPEYIELMKFVIERSKDTKSPINISHLAEEFKENSGSSRGISCLVSRIHYFRSRIHQMDSIDAETKLKILFALSAPIDENFLNELRKNGVIEVDKKNRIIKYRANDRSLEMEGDHSISAKKKLSSNNPIDKMNDPKQIELMNFLIERTRDAKSPLNITQLTKEFKMKNVMRIYYFRMSIHQIDSLDTETKVKMLFALSVPIDKEFLNELRKNAFVEVDGKNRIKKYKANDGRLELEGDHSHSAKMRILWNETKMNQTQSFDDSDENDSDGMKKSVDPSFRRRSALKIAVKQEISTEMPEIVTTRSGRVSKKKINFGDDDIDDDSSRYSFKKKRKTGFTCSKLESKPFHGSIRYTKDLPNPMDGNIPVKVENPIEVEDVKPKFTSKLKFLEAIKSLVISLDTPTLSSIQSKIQKKIWLIGGSNCGISNDEMIPAMDLLVARISNHSISNLSGTVKSVSLKEFLCYLKAVILNSKLEGLEDLLEKIKEKNKTLAMRDKRIPVENVASVLQDTLNNIGF